MLERQLSCSNVPLRISCFWRLARVIKSNPDNAQRQLRWWPGAPLDCFVTPADIIIRCIGNVPRPERIYWEDLQEAMIAEIRALQKLRLGRFLSQ